MLGLAFVTPQGDVVELGGPVADTPGYDLRGTVIGSEGTLGVATRVVVRLLRRPEGVQGGCRAAATRAPGGAPTRRCAAPRALLAAEGCDVVVPPAQECCGALMEDAGEEPAATARARAIITTMEDAHVDTVVINAAGCGSALKEYGRLLAGDPAWVRRAADFSELVHDISELVVELGPRATRHPVDARLACHDACISRTPRGSARSRATCCGQSRRRSAPGAAAPGQRPDPGAGARRSGRAPA